MGGINLRVFVLVVILSITTAVQGAYQSLFETIPLHGHGVGSAVTAYHANGQAFYKNPATLTQMEKPFFNSSYASMYDSMVKGASFSGGLQITDNTYFGMFLPISLVDGIPKTVESNGTGVQTGSYTDYETALQVAFSTVLDHFSVGVAGNYYVNKLYDEYGTALGLDVGIFTWVKNIEFGASVQNLLGTDLEWTNNTTETTEKQYNIGTHWRFSDQFSVASDISATGEDLFGNVGAAYKPVPSLTLEGGIHKVGILNSLRLGLQLQTESLGFHYGWSNHESLGSNHKFGLKFFL